MISPTLPGALRVMNAKWTSGCLLAAVTACTSAPPQPGQTAATPQPQPQSCAELGNATWYRGTARGRASPDELTAAHKTLPLGTLVHVTALDTGQSVVVRINDRGPFARGRIIDLSAPAATQLGMRHSGVAEVRLDVDGDTLGGCPFHMAKLATR